MFCLLLLALPLLLVPQPAYAYLFTQPAVLNGADVCPADAGNPMPGGGLTRRIMPCIKETVLSAVYGLIEGPFAAYMVNTILVMMTLAVALWGIALLGGKRTAPKQDLFILAIKIGAVVTYMANFAGGPLFPNSVLGTLMDIVDQFLGIITNYATVSLSLNCPAAIGDGAEYAVWDMVDCALNALVGGIFNNALLVTGILGFFTACIFSNSPIGLLIALTGFFLILQLVMAIARALFIYVSAFIGLALMVAISPFFVPCILFSATQDRFEKWLRLTMSFMLQPIFLFAYLVMLLAAFDATVYGPTPYSLYNALSGGAECPVGSNPAACSTNIGNFLEAGYATSEIGGKAINIDPGAAERDLGVDLNGDKTGTFGQVMRQMGDNPADWEGTKQDIFNALGISGGPGALRFFQADVPVTGVDWTMLAGKAGQPLTTYIVTVSVSLLMASITAYIFGVLLNFIPYISSGLAENSIGMNQVFASKFEGIGGKMMDRVQSMAANRFMGGGQ